MIEEPAKVDDQDRMEKDRETRQTKTADKQRQEDRRKMGK